MALKFCFSVLLVEALLCGTDGALMMKALKVYWNPSGPKQTVTKFCNDYAAAIVAANTDSSATWLNLWSTQNTDKLEWHGPVGTPPRKGWGEIQGNISGTKGWTAFNCVSAWPTVDNYSAGFIFSGFHPMFGNVSVLDVIDFDMNFKMKKLAVYWNPTGPKAEVSKFCGDYGAAIIAANTDNSAKWLNLWASQYPNELEWHGPVGTPPRKGWGEIQGNISGTKGWTAFNCVSAWPTVDNYTAGFIFTGFHPMFGNVTILDVIDFASPPKMDTCLDVKTEYQRQGCCGMPMKTFTKSTMATGSKSRRLLGENKAEMMESVKAALDQAEAEGGRSQAHSLANALIDFVREYSKDLA